MPYKEISNRYAYRKGYFAGIRKAILVFLGNKCSKCGSTKNLEIDHIKPLNRKSRTTKDLLDMKNIRLLCKKCNKIRSYQY